MDPLSRVRLDVWLDVACLFKTRSEAQRACRGGKVDVNGLPAKPHRTIRIDDRIRISRPFGRKQTLVIRGLDERQRSKAQARELYEDTTPLPLPEEIELRRLERQWRASQRAAHSPNTRERRTLRRFKERGYR